MLSKKQLSDICLEFGGHKRCRYLTYDIETKKHLCTKRIEEVKNSIDERIKVFVDRAKIEDQDLVSLGRPLGDNCKGYLFLKNADQGYDIPGSV